MTLEDEIDQMFLILMGMIVIFMQCGFAFYECGTVRSKNTTNILLKNVLDSYISGIAYWLFGYAFAYGEGNDFIGYSNFALKGLPDTGYANFFFQYSFAATTATIVSGSVAERCEFSAYLIYSFFITGFLVKGVDYGGDIGRFGYTDFAGAGIVHVLGGVAGFVGAAILGPRIGRFHRETKKPVLMRGHSVPVAALGGFILFFGFLAFNGGSLGSLVGTGNGATISLVIVNTIIAGSFGAFSCMMIYRSPKFGSGKFSLLMTINGALTGMVSTCALVNAIYPWTACILGIGAGPVYHIVSYLDFAGAGIVHVLGGVAGFVGAAILGPRIGRFHRETKKPVLMRGHSVPVAALGGFILFFGFLAFNGGSLGSLVGTGNGATISLVIVNTIIAGSFGAFSCMMIYRSPKFGSGKFSLLMTINGALTGMVSTCALMNAIYPWTACILGIGAGPVYHIVSYLVRRIGVDDPLDAVAVHFGGGVFSVLSLPFFHREEGIFYNWNKRSGLVLGWQIADLGTIIIWTAVTTALLFGLMRLLGILRVSEEVETKGLDIHKHEPAYPVEAYGTGHVEKLFRIISSGHRQKVTQDRSAVGYREIKDQGPYENPEVQWTTANIRSTS